MAQNPVTMLNKQFKSLLQLLEAFPDEQSCIEYLEEVRWKGKVVSPFDEDSKVYKCKGNRYKCKNTGLFFNVRTNTMFECSRIPLQKWFMAIYLVHNKRSMSVRQLASVIDVTSKSAWFLLHRIRECQGMENDGELAGIVELDETFVGGKNKNRHWDKKVKNSQGRSFKDKVPVFGMLERGGKLIAKVVPNVTSKSLIPLVEKHIDKGSCIYTDEWKAYNDLGEQYFHKFVKHGSHQYVNGEVHTNTLEGAWASLKRSIIGIHHYVSKKHLQRYVNEFVFRYNTRKETECQRFNLFLQCIGNRLTYKELVNGKEEQLYIPTIYHSQKGLEDTCAFC